jgi:hypothetical protein
MNWKFWQKTEEAPTQEAPGQSRPRDLPEAVGRYMVVDLKMDPDWVWTLKAAMRRREEDRNTKDFRIFNPASADAAGARIRNFNSLDTYPDLVLYEGWYNKKTNQLKLTEQILEKAS